MITSWSVLVSVSDLIPEYSSSSAFVSISGFKPESSGSSIFVSTTISTEILTSEFDVLFWYSSSSAGDHSLSASTWTLVCTLSNNEDANTSSSLSSGMSSTDRFCPSGSMITKLSDSEILTSFSMFSPFSWFTSEYLTEDKASLYKTSVEVSCEEVVFSSRHSEVTTSKSSNPSSLTSWSRFSLVFFFSFVLSLTEVIFDFS